LIPAGVGSDAGLNGIVRGLLIDGRISQEPRHLIGRLPALDG
jgi:hypothetical protein